jgi:hypothetical protein
MKILRALILLASVLIAAGACAVPGIMATRVIENRRDRLVTILVVFVINFMLFRVLPGDPVRSVIGRNVRISAQTQQALYQLGVFDLVRVTPQNPDSPAVYQDVAVRLAAIGYGPVHHVGVPGVNVLVFLSGFNCDRVSGRDLSGATRSKDKTGNDKNENHHCKRIYDSKAWPSQNSPSRFIYSRR